MWLIAVVLGSLFPDKEPDRERLANWLGFTDPRMAEHWHRLRHEPSLHAYSNVWTEWTRLDPQRAWKTLGAVIDLLLLAHLARWIW